MCGLSVSLTVSFLHLTLPLFWVDSWPLVLGSTILVASPHHPLPGTIAPSGLGQVQSLPASLGDQSPFGGGGGGRMNESMPGA